MGRKSQRYAEEEARFLRDKKFETAITQAQKEGLKGLKVTVRADEILRRNRR
jgi:hypothetical protein